MNGHLQKFSRLFNDIFQNIAHKDAIPVVYFTGRPNVGDLLNEYLIPKISGKEIFQVKSNWLPHVRAIGSVIGSASQNSYIWGSGSIDGKKPNRRISKNQIFALRGKLTRDLLSSGGADIDHVPLGDPGLLMPRFFKPDVKKIYNVGIVPHFSDEDSVRKLLAGAEDKAHIISVGQNPEEFVRELLSCHFILSSSLHGLILSDAYGLPNKWVKFSDRLLGGSFKFRDYYSVTSNENEREDMIDSPNSLLDKIQNVSDICGIKKYLGSCSALINGFPKKFMKNY